MLPFSPATTAWFTAAFPAATPVQVQGWAAIARGEHALLCAPTGSGKTLAAFLWALDRLLTRPQAPSGPGVEVLYVSPLKALAYDVDRNLRTPLAGVTHAGRRLGLPLCPVHVAVRTGDTPANERRRLLREPADVLITTPESLYLLLGSQLREALTRVHTVIVDEIHALAPTKRGVHLALSLERLEDLLAERGSPSPQRVGLSATQRPLEEVARYLAGARPVTIVDAGAVPDLDVRIVVPVEDMERPQATAIPVEGAGSARRSLVGRRRAAQGSRPAPGRLEGAAQRRWRPGATERGRATPEDARRRPLRVRPLPGPTPRAAPSAPAARGGPLLGLVPALAPETPRFGIWPELHPHLVALIRGHRTTIVFTNSRRLCERLAQALNDLAGEPLVRAHHGSVARLQRLEIEDALKRGQLRAIVATSSLELGIDMGSVDLVVQVESPGAASRGLQRVGRAGHGVGQRSKARIFPKFRGDLLEATVVLGLMRRGEVEPLRVPRGCLDVLAQQLVAACSHGPRTVAELASLARRTASFAELTDDVLAAVLDMLAGRYPADEVVELRPRLVWDREHDTLVARRDAARIALINGGTIPDRGLFGVFRADGGSGRLGELDEEMVLESRPGDTFILGATTWRIQSIERDRVLVVPAPGEPGRMPFWRGEGPGRPIEVGRELGAFLRTLSAHPPDDDDAAGRSWLEEQCQLDAAAARNLVAYVREQEAEGALPTDRRIVLERFRDELGDWRLCLLSPFGARVHAPLALAIEHKLSELGGFEVQTTWTDDGITLRFTDLGDGWAEAAGPSRLPDAATLLPDADDVAERVTARLADSALFAAHFRENAGRALLLPRRRPGARSPLWQQRMRSAQLLAVVRRFPAFPIVLETYRECLQDVFDLPALEGLLRQVRRREVRVREVETRAASPFARGLVFAFTNANLYDGDAPLAERRASALTLDRRLLGELLGQEELRNILDPLAIDEVEAELQGLADQEGRRKVHDEDALHDLLRRLGDLNVAEVVARSEAGPEGWLASLVASRRAVQVLVAGEPRYLAVEDVARYRDGLGVSPPAGLAGVFLEPCERPLEGLALRWARTHGPFTAAELALRWGLSLAVVEATLRLLEAGGHLVHGELRPGGTTREWCHPDVLRRLRRRSLARLRREIEPVDAPAMTRFLATWHRLGDVRASAPNRLQDAIDQLEGLAIPFSDLEAHVLPARVPGYAGRLLDELGALGEVVWVGRGALGPKDGRVALVRRDRAPLLLGDLGPYEAPSPLHARVLEHLEGRGSSFLAELQVATGEPLDELQAALWDLVWVGRVTNDTFAPLRSLGQPARPEGRFGRRRGPPMGRWSPVSRLRGGVNTTERAHALAGNLLDRHGIVARATAAAEEVEGGFSSLYQVFTAMEDAGKVRRGWFVEDLTGAQFASPGAVDGLRACREAPDHPATAVLALADPANPYGTLFGWPVRDGDRTPPRRPGSVVVLVGGEPCLVLASRKVQTLAPHDRWGQLAWTGLLQHFARGTHRRQRVLTVDDGPAAGLEVARLAGWVAVGDALELPL